MTNRELNQKIKRLGQDYYDLTFESRKEAAYYDGLTKIQKEFRDLQNACFGFTGLNVKSLLILIKLNYELPPPYGKNNFGQFIKLQKLI